MNETVEKKRGSKWLILLMCSLTFSFVFRAELADFTLKVTAQALNRKLPTMMGDGLRLEGVAAAPEKRLLAYLTLLDMPGASPAARQVSKQLPGMVREGACGEQKIRQLLDFGLVLEFSFSGNDGKPVGTSVVDAAACAGVPLPVTTAAH
ncbi:MAG: hypothetical protein OEY97_05055 [Nitrospirota bacterium]|nr:hypothetical protein [Nitrospirota bacterium]